VALKNRRNISAVPDGKGPHSSGQSDEIDAFMSEASLSESPYPVDAYQPVPPVPQATGALPAAFPRAAKWAGALAGSAAIVAAIVWGYQQVPAAVEPGSFSLETTPSGLQVQIDGKAVGKTPLNVSLAAGDYSIALTEPDGRQRTFSVTLPAGGSVVRQLELATTAAAVGEGTGALRVETSPGRAPVTVDGIDRGMSPITVSSLTPGEHVVVIRGANNNNVRRTLNIKEGETLSLVLSVPADAPTTIRAGWVTISTPFSLSLREGGKVIGTTDADRLMLPAGDHEIEMANDALGFRATRRITVAADRTTNVALEVPNGTVSINALPWAEVWIGGERVGETPIANLSRPIGVHEVVLRHPQLGERKARVTVSMKQTARLGVDMRTP
jgi:hypothetical protein